MHFCPCTGRKYSYNERPLHRRKAGIAQLVEHDLAKVGVASSSLVSRSNFSVKTPLTQNVTSKRPVAFRFFSKITLKSLILLAFILKTQNKCDILFIWQIARKFSEPTLKIP